MIMSERLGGSQAGRRAIGYWHGFDRGLSARATSRHGRRAGPGRFRMDMIIVDVTHPCRVGNGHFGSARRPRGNQAGELAARIDTTLTEVLTGSPPHQEVVSRRTGTARLRDEKPLFGGFEECRSRGPASVGQGVRSPP